MDLSKQLQTFYHVECHDADGNLKWSDDFHNLITRAGAGDSLTQHLKGSAYTAAWFVGLTGATPVFATTDTMATHAGWTDSTAYSNATRPAWTGGAVDTSTDTCSVDNSASKAVFTINATATIGGAFLVNNSTKGGTTGVLYGGGAFAGGNRSVVSGDSLSVSISATATAA
jgi:hypothetical protein